MRFKGKKPIFNYKDTWNLDGVLAPIICEGLKKFLEVVEKNDNCAGVPGSFMKDRYPGVDDLTDEMVNDWHSCLREMIYAFKNKKPSSSDYDFDFVFEPEGLKITRLTNTNEAEYARYKDDCKKHSERRSKGLMLFSKYFDGLWW